MSSASTASFAALAAAALASFAISAGDKPLAKAAPAAAATTFAASALGLFSCGLPFQSVVEALLLSSLIEPGSSE